MIYIDAVEKKCAACGRAASYGGRPDTKPAWIGWRDQLLDGRPGKDASVLERSLFLETCPHCGHAAPAIDKTFPNMEPPAAGAFIRHSDQAARYLRIAGIYGTEDPRETGFWTLRAAWADESSGRDDVAAKLRLECAPLLEETLAQGYALYPGRGASLLALADIHRVAGDFDRALDHCRRALLATPPGDYRDLLVFEAKVILDQDRARYSKGEADDAVAELGEERAEIHRRVAAARYAPSKWPAAKGGRLATLPSTSMFDTEDRVHRAGYEEIGRLHALLHAIGKGEGILGVVRRDSALVPMLLRMTRATGERGERARAALEELELVPHHGSLLADHPDAVDALERACGPDAPIVIKVKELITRAATLAG